MKTKSIQEQFCELVDDFTNCVGYIEITAKPIEDGKIDFSVSDGFGHDWIRTEFETSRFNTLKELCEYVRVCLIEDFDPYDELEIIIKSNVEGKPDLRTLCEVTKDVEDSLDNLNEYLIIKALRF